MPLAASPPAFPPDLADMLGDVDTTIAKAIADQTSATRLTEAMAYTTTSGGKRIRAQLILATVSMLAGTAMRQPAVRVAAGYECLHAYSLVHDDLPAMDNAATRRGKPSCHIAFDDATAILVGDALQSLAFAIIADPATHTNAEIRSRLVYDLATAAGAHGMAGGQMLDMLAEAAKDKPFGVGETKRMQGMKTGALIRAAVRAGGILAEVDGATMDRLTMLGADIGAAFQIADDVLDVTADAKATGKPSQQDQAANKATLVAHLGLERARAEAKRLADSASQHIKDILASQPKADNPWGEYLMVLMAYIAHRQV